MGRVGAKGTGGGAAPGLRLQRRRPGGACRGPRNALRAGVAALWAASAVGQAPAPADDRAAPAARAECRGGADSSAEICAVDLVTYIGWRVFDRYCAACHGADALGSAFAPSLVHRVRQIDRRAFFAALDEGYTGRFAPMRPWGEDPEVARYYDELWSYLSARANGDLPPVPLEPLR